MIAAICCLYSAYRQSSYVDHTCDGRRAWLDRYMPRVLFAVHGNFFEIFDAKSHIWGQFGPENKLIEGQPNEYDVICRNASVLAFHLWPTIFAGVPFWLQNICRNGVPPRSRTTTPLIAIGLSVFAGFTLVTNRQTMLQVYAVHCNMAQQPS